MAYSKHHLMDSPDYSPCDPAYEELENRYEKLKEECIDWEEGYSEKDEKVKDYEKKILYATRSFNIVYDMLIGLKKFDEEKLKIELNRVCFELGTETRHESIFVKPKSDFDFMANVELFDNMRKITEAHEAKLAAEYGIVI